MLQKKKNTEKQQSDSLQVIPFDHFRQDGEVSKPPDNYLKAAEMNEEGNYNQIDGIINNEPPGNNSIRQALRDYVPGISNPSHAPDKDQPDR